MKFPTMKLPTIAESEVKEARTQALKECLAKVVEVWTGTSSVEKREAVNIIEWWCHEQLDTPTWRLHVASRQGPAWGPAANRPPSAGVTSLVAFEVQPTLITPSRMREPPSGR